MLILDFIALLLGLVYLFVFHRDDPKGSWINSDEFWCGAVVVSTVDSAISILSFLIGGS